MIDPDDIDVRLEDVGGLDAEQQCLVNAPSSGVPCDPSPTLRCAQLRRLLGRHARQCPGQVLRL